MATTTGADLRRAILDAARAGVAEHGYANLSMRQIARSVGCSVGTIYLYYASKDALYAALVDEAAGRLVDAYAEARAVADPVARLEAFCRSYVRFAMDHPELYKVMYLELTADPGEVPPEAYRRARTTLDDTAAVLAEADSRGALRVANVKEGALFVWAALHGMLSLILARQTDPKADPERLIDLTVRHIVDAFRP